MTQYVRLSQTDQNWEFEKILWWRGHQISDTHKYVWSLFQINKYCSIVNEDDILELHFICLTRAGKVFG